MKTVAHPDLSRDANGHAILTGSLLDLSRKLDRRFLCWAADFGAREYEFPAFLPVEELDRIDYFRSFPHLATFPAAVDPNEVQDFVESGPLDERRAVRLNRPSPIREVLTPAACYHFYVALQGRDFKAPQVVTTRATCFRREAALTPLERQWSFSMRELVCIGTEFEVREFLRLVRERVEAFFLRAALPIEWRLATDPFFNPTRSPGYLMQKVDPVKTEMVFDGRLAIGSINLHRTHFGEAFDIRRDGEPAWSGCVAFGIERWVHAILARFGSDWHPALEESCGR